MTLFNHEESVVVFDFETTGMSPDKGDRAIEIGAVIVRNGKITEHFESLINPGFMITREIENITGINNQMLEDAPAPQSVMDNFSSFIGTRPLIAHNASFDLKFLQSEFTRAGKNRPFNSACTLQISRRIYPDLINYKLETLVRYKRIDSDGSFHRALADAAMTARLWIEMQQDIKAQFDYPRVDFDVMKKIAGMSRDKAQDLIRADAEQARSQQIEITGNLFG